MDTPLLRIRFFFLLKNFSFCYNEKHEINPFESEKQLRSSR